MDDQKPELTRHGKKLAFGRVLESGPLSLIHSEVLGQPVSFCVNKAKDPIQRNHRKGTFYELDELEALIPLFPEGGTFVDIGANVGNHSLFAGLFLKAGRIIPFEPNRLAYDLLINNMLVNGLRDRVDFSMLGIGLSDELSGGFAMERRRRNLGGAKMLAGEGDLKVYRADALLDEVEPDFIKVDVEGMEIKVISGLSGVLGRCRPIIMIEVDNENEEAFQEWVQEVGYATLNVCQQYRSNKNHLIVDKDQLEDLKARFKAPTSKRYAEMASRQKGASMSAEEEDNTLAGTEN
ncbi:FkbM family methyltransferase [Pseudophaeobacter sp.]|uniref:FkbM family methyltransferase n=1 Tax=Pseudophaeobacter sp. TaxID=1971739 RepID=UPI0032970BCF